MVRLPTIISRWYHSDYTVILMPNGHKYEGHINPHYYARVLALIELGLVNDIWQLLKKHRFSRKEG